MVAFVVADVIPAKPEEIYRAWLDSEGHSLMTGGEARVSNRVGEGFEAWGGYIQGRNLELEEGVRIVQAWRTVEFSEEEGDSLLEVTLEAVEEGTLVTLRHSGLPEHGGQYEQGWVENYFQPMKAYFGRRIDGSYDEVG